MITGREDGGNGSQEDQVASPEVLVHPRLGDLLEMLSELGRDKLRVGLGHGMQMANAHLNHGKGRLGCREVGKVYNVFQEHTGEVLNPSALERIAVGFKHTWSFSLFSSESFE